jgi:hypothetical protein
MIAVLFGSFDSKEMQWDDEKHEIYLSMSMELGESV